ncbi:hypothetical protein NMY22_g1335 [Coprinellus aureogranulatus]|nr:hypothetical protein NMY22_g1335 [Coprinellus aureogranulatus]
MPAAPVYYDEATYRRAVTALLEAKDRQFAATGRVAVDPTQMVLFFRSKSGITQSIDFPIDVELDAPPAFDVLVASCRPHQTSDYNNYMERESLFYPPTLPLTISLDVMSNYPILDGVRNALLPNLPPGHYLTAVRDKFELILDGSRLERQAANTRNDGRAATVIVTLPVKFQGGALVVRDPATGAQEVFSMKTKPGESNELEWVAFLGNCEYETQVVDKGYRVMMSYGVYVRNFSPEGAIKFQSLLTPQEAFFDFLGPVLNMSRGKTLGFYLSCDYPDVNPSLLTADSLIPRLKAGDYLLYHSLKMYHLLPELRWTAGEYIWPLASRVELDGEDIVAGLSSQLKSASLSPRAPYMPAITSTPVYPPPVSIPPGYPVPGGSLGMYGPLVGPGPLGGSPPMPQGSQALRLKVQESGGQLLSEAGITVLTDQWNHTAANAGAVERVPFLAGGELQKLVVNVLLVFLVK